MVGLFLEAATTTSGEGGASSIFGGTGFMLIYLVIIGVVFYFVLLRPQKKQQKQLDAMISALEIGDSVLTTSGFYGVVIDVMDEVVIVEFGSNKNCRIPMKKTAITEVEKPGSAEEKDEK